MEHEERYTGPERRRRDRGEQFELPKPVEAKRDIEFEEALEKIQGKYREALDRLADL